MPTDLATNSAYVIVNGKDLQPGDGAAFSDETRLELTARNESEIVVFDLS